MANRKHKKQWVKETSLKYRVRSYGIWFSSGETADLTQFDHLEINRLLRNSAKQNSESKGDTNDNP